MSNQCSYGKFCCLGGNDGGPCTTQVEQCRSVGCANGLHHLCQATFEDANVETIGERLWMSKRCLSCVLLEQHCLDDEHAVIFGFRIVGDGKQLEWPSSLADTTGSSSLSSHELPSQPTPDTRRSVVFGSTTRNRSPPDCDATPPTVQATPDTAATAAPADTAAIAGRSATADPAAGEWPLAHPCLISLPYCYNIE